MDFWDLGRLLLRRWYVALPMLLATAGITGYTAVEVKPDYVLTSYIQLIPPVATSDPTQASHIQNPWLALGLGSLNQAATLATQDQTFLDQLKAEGSEGSFSITMGDNNPVAVIAVVAPTLDQAESTTTRVITQYETSVTSLQAQYAVRQQDMITAHRLDKGENLKRPGGKVKRALVVVLGAGLLLTGGMTIVVDAYLRRRRRKPTPAAKVPSGVSAKSGPPASRDEPVVAAVPSDATIVLPRVRDQSDQGDRGRRG